MDLWTSRSVLIFFRKLNLPTAREKNRYGIEFLKKFVRHEDVTLKRGRIKERKSHHCLK